MPKDFLKIGGKEYRVEVNWNALSEFLQSIGDDTYDGLANIGSMKPSQIPALIAATINEGERLEGRETHLSPKDVGAMIRLNDVEAFMKIYVRQSAAQVSEEEPKKEGGESQET
jgi:hypothetical protein